MLQVVLAFLMFGLLVLIAAFFYVRSDLPTKINAYGNLIVSFLTFFLVIITGFYALVTNRMLGQMIEERQSRVRPKLWVIFNQT